MATFTEIKKRRISSNITRMEYCFTWWGYCYSTLSVLCSPPLTDLLRCCINENIRSPQWQTEGLKWEHEWEKWAHRVNSLNNKKNIWCYRCCDDNVLLNKDNTLCVLCSLQFKLRCWAKSTLDLTLTGQRWILHVLLFELCRLNVYWFAAHWRTYRELER